MQTPLKTRLGAITKIRVHMNLVTLNTNQGQVAELYQGLENAQGLNDHPDSPDSRELVFL